jgi:hypothetical protein
LAEKLLLAGNSLPLRPLRAYLASQKSRGRKISRRNQVLNRLLLLPALCLISPFVRLGCISKFKKKPFHDSHYADSAPRTKYLAEAKALFKSNKGQLPKGNTSPPRIFLVTPQALKSSVVMKDSFGFDTSNDYCPLRGLGDV